jgi:hypothetical protein
MRPFSAAFVGGIVGTIFTSMIAIAWTGPSSAPPNGNVAAPINVGSTAQVKNGGLSVNQLAVFGNGTLTGNFGIKTTNPAYPLDVNGGSRITGSLLLSGASRYLNFGTIVGSGGYGIRDNAGVMQFRNSSGAWSNIGSGTSGVTGSGTANRLPKFTSTTALGNSQIFDNGTNVGVGVTSPSQKLSVAGVVQSTVGGFRFPDGTTQATAARFAGAYTKNVNGSCRHSNPATGGCSCPSGFSAVRYFEFIDGNCWYYWDTSPCGIESYQCFK